MTIEERWASSRGARIHYLDAADAAGRHLVPIVFVPGTFGTAEDYEREMAALVPRRCVAISLRGYAERHPQSLVGLIIGDYPAHYRTIPLDWSERVASSLPLERARLEVARALQRESRGSAPVGGLGRGP